MARPLKQCPFYEEKIPQNIDTEYIPKSQLICMRNLILSKSSEACGILYNKDKYRLGLYIDSYGPRVSSGKIGTCVHSRYTKMIWHTHPTITKSYPSWQDLAKVLKQRKGWENLPIYSFVFTEWGIWEIYCSGPKKKLDEENLKSIDRISQYYSLPIYKRILSSRKTGKKVEVNSDLISDIEIFCEGVTKKLRKANDTFHVKFTAWKNVPNEGYFIG